MVLPGGQSWSLMHALPRAGGALAVDGLQYVASVHTATYQAMLQKVEQRIAAEGPAGCCPMGTTAVLLELCQTTDTTLMVVSPQPLPTGCALSHAV